VKTIVRNSRYNQTIIRNSTSEIAKKIPAKLVAGMNARRGSSGGEMNKANICGTSDFK